MSTLQLLRHAQAKPFSARDHDRELTPDGREVARAVGRWISAGGVPDRVLVSSARRTRQTLELAMQAGGWEAHVVPSDELYSGSPNGVLDALAGAHEGDRSILLVGHEPWCSGLVGLLAGARVRMSPGALATLEVGPGWDAIDPAWCSLTSFVPPWTLTRMSSDTATR